MKRKVLLIVILSVVLMSAAIGGTLAALNNRSGALENTFQAGSASIVLHEQSSNTAKSSITVENTGNVNVYVRVSLVGYWVGNDGTAEEGQIWPGAAAVAGGYNTSDWTKNGDGYYYYNSALAPGGITANLASPAFTGNAGDAPNGYHLKIDVLTECIQAAGGARAAAWG